MGRPETHLLDPERTERFLPGALFAGRYRIVHRLGKGATAEVYRAEDIRLEQTVALKLLFQSRQFNPRALARFRNEARLARRVTHPSVCRIYDFGEAEGISYVSMEHVEGETLADLRRRTGRLSPERTLEVALEICQGLGAVHEQGILHRDLKPANVMFDDRGRARILDFGLAAMAGAVSGADVRQGTPAYMAPEQAAGREVTVRSDLYSLGLVLWELWTGERLRRRERSNPPRISSRVEGVDPSTDRVVARCLSLDPERRPASAESVAAGLEQAAAFVPGPVLRTVVAFDGAGPAEARREATAELLDAFGCQEVWDGQGWLWLFQRPWDAVSCAVAYRAALAEEEGAADLRLAAEVTEVTLRARRPEEPGAGSLALDGDAAPLARALVSLARPGQTLLSALACHLARRAGRAVEGGQELAWLSHGPYRLPGSDEPVEVFEVGVEGSAPLAAPPSLEGMASAVASGMLTGWRPAPGGSIPSRPNFRVRRRLGEGGYGEVWLARHRKTGERRVFKFCFDASHLRGLRREITLFRLLKEELGDRDDIARVLDWNLEEAPFFIESEYTEGGDLKEWAEGQGGAEKIPLEERLELVAQVADALAAAHSVGVLHKDVKPGNILITIDPEGGFKARLADFGIGLVTETERLEAAGITMAGWTTLDSPESDESASGTRLYLAPEVLEGQPPTLQADIYALGVVLYQLIVGHLGRAIAPGWRDGIEDPLLAEDVALALHGEPAGRLQSAQELSARLRSLDERREAARQEALRQREEEERERMLEHAARRRRAYRLGLAAASVLLLMMAALTGWALHERQKEAEARRESESIIGFLVDLFDIADPYSTQATEVEVPELSAVELLERGVDRLDSAFEGEPRVQARLSNTLGTVFHNLGQYERARGLMGRALEIRLEIFGADHLEVAESLNNLAVVLKTQGSYTEAEALYREALAMRRRLLGEEHPHVAESLNNLALVLRAQGSYAEAEALYREALAMDRRLLGEEHPSVATRLNNLASVLKDQGSYAEAEPFYRGALTMRRRLLGVEHPSVAESLNDLAQILEFQGSYAEAEALYREALAMLRRLLGEEHPHVAASLNNLSLVLEKQGSYAEAASLNRESLAMFRRLLGEEHPNVATSLNNLALVLKNQGSYTEAEALYREALAMRRRLLGEEHPAVAASLNNLARVLEKQGSYAEATSHYRESLAMFRRLLGEEHPHMAISLNNLATVLINLGNLEEARDCIEESLAIFRTAYSPNHWRITVAESVEAALRTRNGEYAQAESVLLASYATIAEARGSESSYARDILERLVELYEAWDRPTEAEKYRELWVEAGGRPLH